jgi:hypothetical protein
MGEMQARLECLKIAQALSRAPDDILAEAKRLYGFVAGAASDRTWRCYANHVVIESAGRVYQNS